MLTTILGSISILLAVTRAAPTSTLTIGSREYNIEPVTWTFETGNTDSPTVTVNGTIEEAVAYIKANYNPDFDITPDPTPTTGLAARATDWTSFKCNLSIDKWGTGLRYRFQQGADYLRGVKGSPYNGPGPGACGQVSCSYGSAILWCNDHSTGLKISSFSDIADGADYILNSCPDYDALRRDVNGQVFNGNHWNVILRAGSC